MEQQINFLTVVAVVIFTVITYVIDHFSKNHLLYKYFAPVMAVLACIAYQILLPYTSDLDTAVVNAVLGQILLIAGIAGIVYALALDLAVNLPRRRKQGDGITGPGVKLKDLKKRK